MITRTSRFRPGAFRLMLLTSAAGIASGSPALGQANFHEAFDDLGPTNWSTVGPQALMNRGWVFRNQSQPLGSRCYFSGILPSTNPTYFAPQTGAGYLAVDGGSTQVSASARMASWAILPVIPGQQAGDTFTVWLRRLGSEFPFEVRYSTSGSTFSGTGPDDVGDFTQVLLSVDPVSNAGWIRHQANIPGAGRLAIRFFGEHPGLGNGNPYLGIDSLSIGVPPPPPCNQPPLPQAGQVVVWGAAASPYHICQNITIPAGATVNVEPGVVITFENDRQIVVEGTLNLGGTEANPIDTIAPDNFPPYISVQGGRLDASFTDFGQQLRVSAGATVVLRDCTFNSDGTNLRGGMLTSDSLFGPQTPYVRLERCVFDRSLAVLSDCLVVLRENLFEDTTVWLLRGFADVSLEDAAALPNVFVGRPLDITREEPIQGGFVDGVHATGVGGGAGLRLSGGSWLLGPDVELMGNEYPLFVEGGIMPGSELPATGNANNAVDVGGGGFRGDGRWPVLPIPYRLTDTGSSGGRLLIDSGVTVEALPGAGLLMESGRVLRAHGMPEFPITFRAAHAGQRWSGLFFDTNYHAHPRLENVVIRDADQAVAGVDTVNIRVDNSRFMNNAVGTVGGFNTRVELGKTLFTGNQIGARRNSYLLNMTNPNAFEGNVVAVEGTTTGVTHAELVWWNSPSGPSNHPQNPGGTGDPIGANAGSVSIFPFLTERPDFADSPPIVRAVDPGMRGFSVLNPGTKVILHWDAADDGGGAGIVSQKVSVLGGEFGPITLAENLPGDQRAIEFTVPEVGFEVLNTPQRVRIEAVDTAGQVAIDQFLTLIPSGRITGELAITPQTTSTFVGQTFTAGQSIPVASWSGSVAPFPSIDYYLVLDADSWYIPGFASSGQTGSFGGQFPHASTDLARLALRARNNSNDQKWFYSGYFSIRHDPRLGFVPPQVELVSPAAGASFPGGTVVPISWIASAEEGLYSFDIQASYDGGMEWHMVARELPATARAHEWRLAASGGIADVRVRVIARDRRFQNSSDGMDHVFSITPGSGPEPCYANCDQSTVAPVLNVDDFTCFINEYAAAQGLPHAQQVGHYANCDGSTVAPVLNVDDFTCFINAYARGCP